MSSFSMVMYSLLGRPPFCLALVEFKDDFLVSLKPIKYMHKPHTLDSGIRRTTYKN